VVRGLLPQVDLSQFGSWWTQALGVIGPVAVQTVEALAVAVLTLIVAGKLRAIVQRSLKRAKADPSVVLLVGQVTFFVLMILGLIWILGIYGLPATAIFATVGAVSLAASLALQDVLRNLVAGVYLLIERPFRLGDRLTVRGFEGVVEDVDVRVTTLRTADGERVLVPNAILFTEVLVNHGVVRPPDQGPLMPEM
jgi:small conductance mechanosensitive channel